MGDPLEQSRSNMLKQWATNIMAYPGVMSEQDWKQLCQDDLGKFWLNIVDTTRPQKLVATLKSTLLLYPNMLTQQSQLPVISEQKKDSEWQSLMEQRNKLARERTALQNGIRLKNAEIDDVHAKLLSLEQDHEVSQEASTELATRCSLLSSQMASCEQWCQVIKEYEQRVKAHHDYLASREQDEGGDVSYAVSKTLGRGTLESLTTHVVKDALFCVKQLLSVLTDHGSDKSTVQDTKARASKSVEELLSNHPIRDILQSLCDITKETDEQLRSHTHSINLKQDTKQLRFHCQKDSGELRDVSNRTPLLRAIHSHIKEAQFDHVRCSRSAEESQLAVHNLQQKLVVLQHQVGELLQKHYQGHPHLLKLTRDLMELECKITGAKGALQILSSTESTLRAACEQQQSLLQELHEKHKRIEEYTSRTTIKQSKIELLTRQNSNIKHRLLKQRREVMSYAQQRVVSQHSMVVVSADHLMDTSDSEALLLSNVDLQHQPQHEINRDGVVVAVLGCHGYLTCELVLDKTAELLQKVEELRKELREKQMNLNSTKLDTNLFEVHRRLMDDISRHAQQVILPQLHNQLQKTNNGVQQCSYIKAAIDEWWTQPAQLLVPWVTQQGMNVNQWLEQWRTLVTSLE